MDDGAVADGNGDNGGGGQEQFSDTLSWQRYLCLQVILAAMVMMKMPLPSQFFPQKTDSDVWSRCIPQFHMHNHACFALGQRWGCKEIKNSVISGDVVILRINHPEYCHEWLVKQPKKCRDNAIGFGTL